MNIKGYRVRILCEDKAHYHFIREFLGVLGAIIPRGDEDLVADLPEGEGSAEQFVRIEFPVALQQHARSRENVFLAVVLDVDKAGRESEKMWDILNKSAKASDQEIIQDSDKLLLAFPKKNIQTWFKWLEADDSEKGEINETKDYKNNQRKAKPGKLGKAAGELYMSCRSRPSDDCPILPSIQHTYSSLERLDKLLESRK